MNIIRAKKKATANRCVLSAAVKMFILSKRNAGFSFIGLLPGPVPTKDAACTANASPIQVGDPVKEPVNAAQNAFNFDIDVTGAGDHYRRGLFCLHQFFSYEHVSRFDTLRHGCGRVDPGGSDSVFDYESGETDQKTLAHAVIPMIELRLDAHQEDGHDH